MIALLWLSTYAYRTRENPWICIFGFMAVVLGPFAIGIDFVPLIGVPIRFLLSFLGGWLNILGCTILIVAFFKFDVPEEFVDNWV